MSALRGRGGGSQFKQTAGWPKGSGYGYGTVRPMVLLLAKTLFIPLASAAPLSIWQRSMHALEDDVESPKSPDDPNLWVYLGVAVALVLLGGAFAGLTIALMGQDETYLQVIATSGEGSERKHATKVLNLLKKGKHWVLVTLLLGNVITNETLPIVLDRSLGGGWPAVLSSTVLIVIFGEIAPQSVCVRYGLPIGSFMAPLVLALMWLMSPVAWPTAKLLDWLLGEDHGTTYKKAGLKTLVQLHKTLGGERLMEDEVTIINSVLDLKEKPVGAIMTPMQDVFTMSADTVLDEPMMDLILSQGYSRIPIYAPDNRRNFIGMLLVKMLITYDPEDAIRVRDCSLATLPETGPNTSCLDIINFFQEGKSHMVLVSDFPGSDKGALGVVTLEDVIEEVIGEEIIDESDVYVDVHKAIRRVAPAPRQRFPRKLSVEPTLSNDPEGKDVREDEPLLGNDPSSRKSSMTNGGPRPTAFTLRRRSSNVSEPGADTSAKGGTVPVRTNTAEMKEHLRHLGPSNVASRPRATKYQSVKIKPGVGTIPENQATTTGIGGTGAINQPNGSVDEAPVVISNGTQDESENNRLLSSAGKDASDASTAALRAGYGTLNSPPRKSGDPISASEASKIAEEKASPSPPGTHAVPHGDPSASTAEANDQSDPLKVPDKMVVGSVDEDTVGEMEGPTRERSKSKRGVRSGSITETEINVGGMKKMVLGTASDDEDDEGEGSGSVQQNEGAVNEDGEDGEGLNGQGDGQQDDGGKRKKRGKRKKDS